MKPTSRIILCIPGHWPSRDDLVSAVAKTGTGYAIVGDALVHQTRGEKYALESHARDAQLRRAFEIAGRGRMLAADFEAIGDHTFSLFLICPGGSFEAARAAMGASAALLAAGGLAIKVESAGTAASKSEWMEWQAKSDVGALYHSFVVLVGDHGSFYSCGMHNLGFPDAKVLADIPSDQAANLLTSFLGYLLTENPMLKDGHTFSVDEHSPHYRLKLTACDDFPDKEDPFRNPFGVWLLRPK